MSQRADRSLDLPPDFSDGIKTKSYAAGVKRIIVSENVVSRPAVKLLQARLYDYPKYYDVVFGAEWRAEFRFLELCFREFVSGRCRRLLEPACGTGRLLYRLAKARYQVHGLDLNPRAVAYCNRRLRGHELPETAIVADMTEFSLEDFGGKQTFDAAFNTINSFRHLPTEQAAQAHLQCVAECLRPGGVYVLGLHLTPPTEPVCLEESWEARRGTLQVSTRLVSNKIDRENRCETFDMLVDVHTPTQDFHLRDEMRFRTYSAEQLHALLNSVDGLKLIGSYDFGYDLDDPLTIDETTEDVVLVLQRT